MNMIQNAKDQVLDLTVAAYGKAAAQGLLPEDVAVTPSVEIPKDTANGDYTTTFCLAAAKALKKNPRQVAQILMDHMDLAGSYFTSVEMAGPGFLNFRLGDKWFRDTVACVEREGADYLGVGAVFPTGTKADANAVSYDTLREICAAVSIPVIAIGGITKDNVARLSGSGIVGVAVVSAIFAQPDIPAATRALKAAVRTALDL